MRKNDTRTETITAPSPASLFTRKRVALDLVTEGVAWHPFEPNKVLRNEFIGEEKVMVPLIVCLTPTEAQKPIPRRIYSISHPHTYIACRQSRVVGMGRLLTHCQD